MTTTYEYPAEVVYARNEERRLLREVADAARTCARSFVTTYEPIPGERFETYCEWCEGLVGDKQPYDADGDPCKCAVAQLRAALARLDAQEVTR